MDPKEQELIKARTEAYCDWDKAERKWIEACRKRDEANCKRDEDVRNCVEAERKWIEACHNWDKACRKLWKYQNRRITMTENGTPMNETAASKQTPRTTTLDVFKLALGWMDGSMEDAKRRFAVASLQEQNRICEVMAASSSRIIDPLNAQYFMDKRDEHFGLLSRA